MHINWHEPTKGEKISFKVFEKQRSQKPGDRNKKKCCLKTTNGVVVVVGALFIKKKETRQRINKSLVHRLSGKDPK